MTYWFCYFWRQLLNKYEVIHCMLHYLSKMSTSIYSMKCFYVNKASHIRPSDNTRDSTQQAIPWCTWPDRIVFHPKCMLSNFYFFFAFLNKLRCGCCLLDQLISVTLLRIWSDSTWLIDFCSLSPAQPLANNLLDWPVIFY